MSDIYERDEIDTGDRDLKDAEDATGQQEAKSPPELSFGILLLLAIVLLLLVAMAGR